MKKLLILACCILLPSTGNAIGAGENLDDPALQIRYEKLIAEVRCLKCQNQTIKDSNAFLAGDLRREIRRLLLEGKSDAEIFDYLVLRYGEFALYRPRASGKTLILWIAPFFLLLGGGIIMVRILRERMRMPLGDDQDTQADS